MPLQRSNTMSKVRPFLRVEISQELFELSFSQDKSKHQSTAIITWSPRKHCGTNHGVRPHDKWALLHDKTVGIFADLLATTQCIQKKTSTSYTYPWPWTPAKGLGALKNAPKSTPCPSNVMLRLHEGLFLFYFSTRMAVGQQLQLHMEVR